MKRLIRFCAALPFGLFLAASCSASSSNDRPGSGGAGGGTGGGDIDGGAGCGVCTLKSYTPCVDGKPGTP
ncbi:MAG TPA: hypothetical protein PKD61_14375, partial [Polyangiaceae bacterium]|nr:hypothetical protein [Polyangiaceae bacterium]